MMIAVSESFPVNLPIPILSVVIGGIILFFGRKIFWLCVAAVGFAAGVELAPHLIHEPSSILALSVAHVLGFAGAILALFLQKIAIAVVGFLAGGKLAIALVGAFFVQLAPYFTITFLIGGVIGAILLLALFDWALVFFSAIVGAHLIQSVISLPPTGSAILFVALTAIGLIVQIGAMRRDRPVVA